jgi:hypothetical protein
MEPKAYKPVNKDLQLVTLLSQESNPHTDTSFI